MPLLAPAPFPATSPAALCRLGFYTRGAFNISSCKHSPHSKRVLNHQAVSSATIFPRALSWARLKKISKYFRSSVWPACRGYSLLCTLGQQGTLGEPEPCSTLWCSRRPMQRRDLATDGNSGNQTHERPQQDWPRPQEYEAVQLPGQTQIPESYPRTGLHCGWLRETRL
jgi:hypothetical protein